jgi:hypothetical protein
MRHSSKCLSRGLAIVVASLSISTLVSCGPQGSRDPEARPAVSEREDLAKRLKLSAARFETIRTGGQTPIAVAFDADRDCSDGYCTCTGDEDCNDMFSGICSSPSTGGICQIRDNVPRCRCKDPRAR